MRRFHAESGAFEKTSQFSGTIVAPMPIWRSKRDLGPPGTVTASRHPGASQALTFASSRSGSSKCSSTSGTYRVSGPVLALGRRLLIGQQVPLEEFHAGDLASRHLDARCAQFQSENFGAGKSCRGIGGEVTLAAADIQQPLRRPRRAGKQQFPPVSLRGVACADCA